MAKYFAIFERQENDSNIVSGQKYASAEIMPQKAETGGIGSWSGNTEIAKVVKIEAASVAEAQAAIGGMFPSAVTSPIVCVLEAQFKTT